MKHISLEKLSSDSAVCEWLGLKPTTSNTYNVEECITRFLENTDEDRLHFNDSPRTEFEIVEWVVGNLEQVYECEDSEGDEGRKAIAFSKKCLKTIWKNYKGDEAFEKIISDLEQFDFIEKLVEQEKAKTLPEGTKTWTMTSSKHGTSSRHLVIKNGKWVRDRGR